MCSWADSVGVTSINTCHQPPVPLVFVPHAHAHAHAHPPPGTLCRIVTQVQAGADLEIADPDGSTALVFACDAGHKAVSDVLLLGGANALAKDKQGYTPLHYAVWSQKQELAIAVIAYCEGNCNEPNNAGPCTTPRQAGPVAFCRPWPGACALACESVGVCARPVLPPPNHPHTCTHVHACTHVLARTHAHTLMRHCIFRQDCAALGRFCARPKPGHRYRITECWRRPISGRRRQAHSLAPGRAAAGVCPRAPNSPPGNVSRCGCALRCGLMEIRD